MANDSDLDSDGEENRLEGLEGLDALAISSPSPTPPDAEWSEHRDAAIFRFCLHKFSELETWLDPAQRGRGGPSTGCAARLPVTSACAQRLSSARGLRRGQHAPCGFLGWVLRSPSVQQRLPMVCRVEGARMCNRLLVYRSQKPDACVGCCRIFHACWNWTAMCCQPRRGLC